MAGSRHDESYKRLFSHPRAVKDLLRGFVHQPWVNQIDFSTLEKLSTEWVSSDLRKRHGDTVWGMRLREGDEWRYLAVLLEFQSKPDRLMALRINTYANLLCEELVRNSKVAAGGPLPFVLPVVLYNGEPEWLAPQETRALFAKAPADLARRMPASEYVLVDVLRGVMDTWPSDNLMSWILRSEQSRSLAEIAKLERSLDRAAVDEELRLAFREWVWHRRQRWASSDTDEPTTETPEEGKQMSLDEWVQADLARSRSEGIAQGLARGMKQGVVQQRALLGRLADRRFGSETAARVVAALEQTVDPERLAEAGEAIVQCASGEELVERLVRIANGDGAA